jgi:DNA-binding MarR family transcriptional regulator
MSSLLLTEARPLEAFQQACEAVERGEEDAWEALDRHFRWHLLEHLLNHSGKPAELGEAVLQASLWARRNRKDSWRDRWSYLLQILEGAARHSSLAGDVQALGAAEGRAAEMLSILLQHRKPLRPSDLVERMRLSMQQVSNLGRKLEEAGLIVRQSLLAGRHTWYSATPRAESLQDRLPGSLPIAEQHKALSPTAPARPKAALPAPAAPEIPLWNLRAAGG